MTTLASLTVNGLNRNEFCCQKNLNLYDSPTLERLATQAAVDRHLRIETLPTAAQPNALSVRLCEDDYPGWLAAADLQFLTKVDVPYQPRSVSRSEIQTAIPQVIAFTKAAMEQPNHYLWGGTVAPNYDCSGLIQAAFASVGIWLPRDAYQQEAFVEAIEVTDLRPGDLVFFGTPVKATHVGLYLGDDRYIHSSGKDQGRNGIGIDLISGGDAVSQNYQRQWRGAGRITAAYQPQQKR